MGFSIGIDLGGTKVSGLVVNADNEVITESTTNTRTRDQAAVIGCIKDLMDQLLADGGVGPGQLAGIGLGVAGHVDSKRGRVIFCPNLPIENLDLGTVLKTH
jgi:glucokinase